MSGLADDRTVVERLLHHIDHKTTDLSEASWREPVEHYRSAARLAAELGVLRRHPVVFCPSAALPEPGSYLARDAARTPILAVRGGDGRVRAFRNACRHRGTQVASGAGCEKAFVCPYHGWTYGLDGALRHVPHEHGFLGLDKTSRGLVPVGCVERSGLVFVAQDAPDGALDDVDALPPMLDPSWRLVATQERELRVNWKIFAESFLEGYHIRSTHPQTFFPLQYDNLNVVETFGRNSRVAFPYRAIEKLRARPRDRWSVDGKLTYVYHLFPNVMVATFVANVFVIVLEPLAADATRFVTYALARGDVAMENADVPRGVSLVDAGGAEDRAVCAAIQAGLASGANEYFEFGRFEGAIRHFHRALDAAIDGTPFVAEGPAT